VFFVIIFGMKITPSQTEGKPCVYCNLKEIKDREITGNQYAWAFPTNIPITPGHTLIAPRRCAKTLEDLTHPEIISILNLAERIMASLRSAFGAEGFNCVWNQEKLAGQSVPHFHLHIIPRKEGDTGLLGYDPRSMLYRTGDREPTPEAELVPIVEAIQKHLPSH
jgi:diadenosine tetraphosphate (Ap4A) HIT family hydrolase